MNRRKSPRLNSASVSSEPLPNPTSSTPETSKVSLLKNLKTFKSLTTSPKNSNKKQTSNRTLSSQSTKQLKTKKNKKPKSKNSSTKRVSLSQKRKSTLQTKSKRPLNQSRPTPSSRLTRSKKQTPIAAETLSTNPEVQSSTSNDSIQFSVASSSSQIEILESPASPPPSAHILPTNVSIIPTEICVGYLKNQLKKATYKFDKACRQLNMLDQQMNDLQNSYTNSLENDRKTFKIIYRMQLATYEGAHNAYIEYIERQVEKIKKLKRLLFNESSSQQQVSSIEINASSTSTS